MRPRSASHRGRLAHLASVVLLVASATGCAGTRKAALREDLAAAPDVSAPVVAVATPTETPVAPAVEPKQEPVQQQVSPEHVEAHVRAQVAQRMPGAATTTHRKVATTVLTESTRAGVDPLLVVALIHVESSFNPRARSRAGALGLMQVRVPTLREQLHRPKARRAEALDPHTNVMAGVRYFRRLLDTFGATDLALMAYNAGPGRIQRLLARGSIPPRFHDYSRKVADELERIRNALLRPRGAESTQPSLRDMPALETVATSRPAS
jgi:soluble lytic murein transglycosylase-like protein